MDVRFSVEDQSGAHFAASCCNFLSFILALIGACSPWWVYGYYAKETPVGAHTPAYGDASVSASPWIAGYAWKNVPSYSCSWCYVTVALRPVYWGTFGAAEVCANKALPIYTNWAKPLGYCTITGDSDGSDVFSPPWNPIVTQGLVISAVVFLFVTSVAGCMAGGVKSSESSTCDWIASFFSLVSMVLLCATFSSWSDWQWVHLVIGDNGYTMPVWVNENQDTLTAIPTVQVYGPGWGLILGAFILTFFATCLHVRTALNILSFEDVVEESQKKVPENDPATVSSSPPPNVVVVREETEPKAIITV